MPAEANLDESLARLRDAAQQIRGNLVELELDPDRALLERSPLAGRSAASWASARQAIAYLWHGQELLEALLARAGSLRAAKRWGPAALVELQGLLEGPSIELSTREVPLAERVLLAGPQATVRCTPTELLARMSTAFDEAKTVVAAIGDAWAALRPQVDAAAQLLAETQRQAETVGESTRPDLAAADRRLHELSRLLTTDPLSVFGADIEAVAGSLRVIGQDVAATAALAGDLAGQLATARRLLALVRAASAEGGAAHRELLLKIAAPDAAPAPALGAELDAELARVAGLAASGAWREARAALDRWTARTAALLAEAQRVLGANRAPIEARNQFRGLLDAYQAKAITLGLVEDANLAAILERARHELYTAPTDLALVAELVRRYQDRLTTEAARPAP